MLSCYEKVCCNVKRERQLLYFEICASVNGEPPPPPRSAFLCQLVFLDHNRPFRSQSATSCVVFFVHPSLPPMPPKRAFFSRKRLLGAPIVSCMF
ncbi:hypothetical protein SKAU_G00383300 [Synaphobranchus kaupii]|uniref:Uncharacterized protein n=1 Tax=Synaphobranchus kaupii TaxID=118154 RepID=A0A9Q1IE18_SYNKA|nr:hypothetical protein SKAU_G00383300 [Synaphobranchus kaupii]